MPPSPPRPPTYPGALGPVESPEVADDPDGETAGFEDDEETASESEGPVPGDSRYGQDLLDEPEAEGTVRVAPGLAVPTYPVVINAPVEALIDQFVARDRERLGCGSPARVATCR